MMTSTHHLEINLWVRQRGHRPGGLLNRRALGISRGLQTSNLSPICESHRLLMSVVHCEDVEANLSGPVIVTAA